MIPMRATSSSQGPAGRRLLLGPGLQRRHPAALALAERGYQVKEMIGGIEYWIREGFPVRTADGS